MRSLTPTLLVLAQAAGGLLLFVPLALLAGEAGPAGGGAFVFFLLLNGWAVYAFLSSRHGRQDELARVLAATVEAGAPLAPAVRSYAADRPRPGPLETLAGLFRRPAGPGEEADPDGGPAGDSGPRAADRACACVFLPLYAYTRLVAGWRSFDDLVGRLASRLESGDSLAAALRAVPAASCREVRLAAAVGEATGALGPCLKIVARERWSAAWLEVLPRILYPLVVLVFVALIASFLVVVMIPKYQRIFQEFGEPLPQTTTFLFASWAAVEDYAPVVPVAAVAGLIAAAAAAADPTARWYTPVVGRLYRWGLQAEVLRTLGRLLAVGRTVPESLGFLSAARVLPPVARRRLDAAAAAVGRGEPLADALAGAGLLPTGMAPLVRAAEQVRTLPGALVELGDHLAGRAMRLIRWASLVVAPVLVVAVGAAVGFIVVAMFLPLIQLLTRLGP